jgi:hypothetical protein
MLKRIAAIVFIFGCTAVAWVILGASIFERTNSADKNLRGQVESIWGAPHTQAAPIAKGAELVTKVVEATEDGKRVTREATLREEWPFVLEQTRARVVLGLNHRQKGLLWYSTYRVEFYGDYTFRNPTSRNLETVFEWKLPAAQAIYDDLVVLVDGAPVEFTQAGGTVTAKSKVPGGKSVLLSVGYRSQGLDTWRYDFGDDVSRVRDFELRLTTNCKDFDFPKDSLAATEKRATSGGWELVWRYQNLVTGYDLGIAMPQKLQPGPLAGRISLFAPVSLFFFFFLMFIFTTLREIDLHPMNYFFLAAAFFSFHLLLAYLVDHISIHLAFAISAAVSIFLVVSYLRLVVSPQFAWREAGLSQLVYLVLFSYAFFFEGYTGLSVTILSVLTLFVVMQMTGRVRWSEKFASRVKAT